MTTKEAIKKEIDDIPEESLDELHLLIVNFTHQKKPAKQKGLMAKLQKIKIQGPKDFAMNIDAYLNGEMSGR